MDRTGIIVLAAGGSSRMRQSKQLLHYRGKPLVRHAVETAVGAGCQRVLVVLGSRSAEIRSVLADLPVEMIENPRWHEGMGTSIQAGIEAVEGADLDGIILTLADQPQVTSAMFQRLFAEHTISGRPIIASQYAGTVGAPAFFSREFYPQLRALPPDQGCKGVILSHAGQAICLDCPEAEADIDTPEDYNRISAKI